jgi:signal transduction histidine kinase
MPEPPMRPLDFLRRWLEASLRNRAAFIMVSISMAAATILAAASFFASQRLIAENTRQTHAAALAAFERQIDFESRALIRMLEAMARNSFISNALIDSLGRDQYLAPFLRDQAFPGDWSGTLWLVDFKGRPIASNKPGSNFPHTQSAALRSSLSSGRQQVEASEDARHLVIATPVVFPPTRSIEGAVVADVDLAAALDRSAALVASGNCFRVIIGGAGVNVPRDCAVSPAGPVLSDTLALSGALTQMNPKIELYVRTEPSVSTLSIYVLAYVAVICTVFLGVLWASRRMAGQIVNPLARVTEAADTIVRDNRLDLRVAVEGTDEVGRLATSFNQMVQSLQAAQARVRDDMDRIRRAEGELKALNTVLERRVVERTADLENTVIDLNKARDAAEKANRAKSEFLSRMSHELRTPLNAMLGFAQILRLRGTKVSADDRDLYVGQIEKAGWHLLELIKELLDLSRIEAGTMLVSREPVPLQRLCAECIELLRPVAGAAGIAVINRTGDVEPLAALGDGTRLSQVLMNLLSNAIKYNRRGGSVTVTLSAVDRDWVEIGVTDTGRGFTAEQLRDLYQPFNRLGADREATDGTGIGLVISKRLIEMMGGQLELVTKEGAGAQFTLRLPRAPHPEEKQVPPQDMPASPASRPRVRRTVLYIEDNPSNVDLVESVFSMRPDAQLITAPDGPTGLSLVNSRRPNLILIDIGLPGIDGYEVCRRLRARDDMKATPILALSANAMKVDRERGQAAGFDDYLTKPLDVRVLLSHIDRLLQGSAP